MEVTESLDAGYNRARPKALGEPLTEAAVLDTVDKSWETLDSPMDTLRNIGSRLAAPRLSSEVSDPCSRRGLHERLRGEGEGVG